MNRTNQVIFHPTFREKKGVFRRFAPSLVDNIFERLSELDLLGKQQVIDYLRRGLRMNHKAKSLYNGYLSIELFLCFCSHRGKNQLEQIAREDLEGFIEHEQDRGLKITSIKTKIDQIRAFLKFLVDQNILPERILKRKIRFNLPDLLPRAINPDDIRQLLSVIRKPRDRAIGLLLLRTGMRIGELIRLKVSDLDVRDKKIHIYEGEKNALGRVVYLSEDALFALIIWLSKRNPNHKCLFYAMDRDKPMAYSTARKFFDNYLRKAKLDYKGYTIHSLRHTFATDLLNAGMRLECVQQLLGHHNIEITRRYARLSDKSREEEYFRAMAIIEHGGINGSI